jgi:hypothetical protein
MSIILSDQLFVIFPLVFHCAGGKFVGDGNINTISKPT